MQVKRILGTVAATTALIRTAYHCDCNPSLYLTDLWFQYSDTYKVLQHRQQRRRGIPSTNNQQQQQYHPFQNQCIWIIGASSGIGEELAYQLVSPIHRRTNHRQRQRHQQLQEEPSVHHPIHLILSSRSVDALQKVATTRFKYNPNCTVTILPMDVTIDEDMYKAIQQLQNISDETGLVIDTIVFNAGAGHLSPAIETTSVTTIDTIWKQTARYPMILIPLLLLSKNQSTATKSLMNDRRPHFVMTLSIAAMVPVPLSSIYGAAKSALWNYCRTLHAEHPILLLHTIMPGPVDTNFHDTSKYISSYQQDYTTNENNNNNNNNNNIHPTTTAAQSLPIQQQQRSPMKMSVQRCVQLMISTMRLSYSTESWLVPSSSTSSPFLSVIVLLGLYLHKVLPIILLQSIIYSKLGPKRIEMWRNGYDLYDPKSWRK